MFVRKRRKRGGEEFAKTTTYLIFDEISVSRPAGREKLPTITGRYGRARVSPALAVVLFYGRRNGFPHDPRGNPLCAPPGSIIVVVVIIVCRAAADVDGGLLYTSANACRLYCDNTPAKCDVIYHRLVCVCVFYRPTRWFRREKKNDDDDDDKSIIVIIIIVINTLLVSRST